MAIGPVRRTLRPRVALLLSNALLPSLELLPNDKGLQALKLISSELPYHLQQLNHISYPDIKTWKKESISQNPQHDGGTNP